MNVREVSGGTTTLFGMLIERFLKLYFFDRLSVVCKGLFLARERD